MIGRLSTAMSAALVCQGPSLAGDTSRALIIFIWIFLPQNFQNGFLKSRDKRILAGFELLPRKLPDENNFGYYKEFQTQ